MGVIRRALVRTRRWDQGLLILLLYSLLAYGSSGATAQTIDYGEVADTSNPRATLRSFIDNCNELHRLILRDEYLDADDPHVQRLVNSVLDCMDVSELPAFAQREIAGETAVCIKEILDRTPIPRWEEIPDEEAIAAAGGLEKFPGWRLPGARVTIVRIPDGARKHEYLFSAGTVDRAIDYFHSMEEKPYRSDGPATSPGFFRWYMSAPRSMLLTKLVKVLPDWMRFSRSYGVANWKWPGVLIGLFLGFLLMVAAYRVYFAAIGRTFGKRVWLYGLTLIFPILAMSVPKWFEWWIGNVLAVRGPALFYLTFGTNAVFTLSAVVVVFGTSARIAEAVIASPRINRDGLNAQLIRLASKLVSVGLGVLVLLMGGQYLGIPVTTLLASAGIGGVALALGAQDMLKTLFGTIMLMADKPFRVGQLIVFRSYTGVVEDIGLRSTKLRMLNGHLVTIPNDELARGDIENMGKRDFIRRDFFVRLPLETRFEKVKTAVAIIEGLLVDHEGLRPSHRPRVVLQDIGSEAYSIRVIYWYHPPHFWDYLGFNGKLNFSIGESLEAEGIQVAMPTRIAHVSDAGDEIPVEVRVVDGDSVGDGSVV